MGDMNRHERRTKAARLKTTLKARGTPGIKLVRRMIRANGFKETIAMMSGQMREQRRFPTYPVMGNYTREGFKLTKPKGKK